MPVIWLVMLTLTCFPGCTIPQYGSLAPRHCAHVEYWLQSYTFSLVNWNQQRKYITTVFIYICMPVIIINIIYTHLSGILQRKYITTFFIYICMPVIISIIYTTWIWDFIKIDILIHYWKYFLCHVRLVLVGIIIKLLWSNYSKVSGEWATKNNSTEYMSTSLLFHENKCLIFLLNKILWYSLYICQKNEWKMNSNFTS